MPQKKNYTELELKRKAHRTLVNLFLKHYGHEPLPFMEPARLLPNYELIYAILIAQKAEGRKLRKPR